jgi:glutathione S-transferase
MTHEPLPRLRLTGRSSSHFTRVARMVALELGIPVALDVVADLASVDADDYGGNPALKIPTLHVGDVPLFGTDNICRRLAALAGRADDPRVVLTHQVPSDLVCSAQELVWHAMAAQVQLVIGVHMARLPADHALLAKARAGLVGALGWLDARLDGVLAALPAPRDLSVFEVTLYCLVEHLRFRPTVAPGGPLRLAGFAAAFGARESAQRTPFCFDPPSSSIRGEPTP